MLNERFDKKFKAKMTRYVFATLPKDILKYLIDNVFCLEQRYKDLLYYRYVKECTLAGVGRHMNKSPWWSKVYISTAEELCCVQITQYLYQLLQSNTLKKKTI